MPAFRPSARVRLQVRLEEYQDTAVLVSRLDKPIPAGTQVLAGTSAASSVSASAELAKVQAQMAQLAAQRADLSPAAYTAQMAALKRKRDRLQRAAESSTLPAQPETIDGSAPDKLTVVMEMLPLSLSIERNGIRAADTCTVELRYQDVPIDPRVIRKAFIEVIVGTVTAEDFEFGMQGLKRSEADFLFSVVPRDAGSAVLSAQTKFVGFVDTWRVTYDSEDGDLLQLQCRDCSGMLIDKELPLGESIDMGVPLVTGIKALLDSIPPLKDFPVQFGRPGESDGLGPVPGNAVAPARKARRGRVTKRTKQGDTRMTVWDAITDVTVQTGFVPMFFGTTLHLIAPRTLYQDKDTPKRVVYGRQLSQLQFTRKISGETVPTIEVRSYDPQIGHTRWARYPTASGATSSGILGVDKAPEPKRANAPGVSGANPDDKIFVFVVSGINDPQNLAVVAKSIFDQIGRQEIEGSFTTSNIDSDGAPWETGDLLNLQAGDAIELLTLAPSGTAGTGEDPGDSASSVQRLQALSRASRAAYMTRLGWNQEVAQKIAALQDATGFQTTFRVQTVQIEYSADDGLEISVDFINFITVRENAAKVSNLDDREPPSAAVSRLAGNRQTEAALAARSASSDRRTLTRDREDGRLTQQEYDAALPAALNNERQRVRNLESQ